MIRLKAIDCTTDCKTVTDWLVRPSCIAAIQFCARQNYSDGKQMHPACAKVHLVGCIEGGESGPRALCLRIEDEPSICRLLDLED